MAVYKEDWFGRQGHDTRLVFLSIPILFFHCFFSFVVRLILLIYSFDTFHFLFVLAIRSYNSSFFLLFGPACRIYLRLSLSLHETHSST